MHAERHIVLPILSVCLSANAGTVFYRSTCSGVTKGTEGAVAPGRSRRGGVNGLTKIFTHLIYLTLTLFVFPRLCIGVVQFCSKLADAIYRKS